MTQPAKQTDPAAGTPDPLIDEIRAIRKKLSDRFDNDVDRLMDHLQEVERSHPGPILSDPSELNRGRSPVERPTDAQ
jgi:hypothetical protein